MGRLAAHCSGKYLDRMLDILGGRDKTVVRDMQGEANNAGIRVFSHSISCILHAGVPNPRIVVRLFGETHAHRHGVWLELRMENILYHAILPNCNCVAREFGLEDC